MCTVNIISGTIQFTTERKNLENGGAEFVLTFLLSQKKP